MITGMLNRSALIVRPSVVFLDWAASLDDSGVVPDPDGEQTVYLIPEVESLEEVRTRFPEMLVEIFERELADWDMEEEAWPTDRSIAEFRLWFEAELHTMVEDLCPGAIEDDEDDD